MKALYQSFIEIPVSAVSFQGLIQMIAVAGVVIFKILMPKPKKKDRHPNDK